MSYSKGQWKIVSDEARGRPRRLIVDAGGDEIAAVNPYRDAADTDAQLMASAPAMLLACKVALSSLRHSGIVGRSPETDVLEAAIQQAEGGESSKS